MCVIQTTHPEWLGGHPWILPVSLVLLLCGLILWLLHYQWAQRLLGIRSSVVQPLVPAQTTSGTLSGIPTLSALLGQDSKPNFDAKKFFARAYYSPVTAEVEKNIKIVARQSSPDDTEAFYARFIGVGAMAFSHEYTFVLIFGSQLRAMQEISSRGLIPISDLQKHYDKAVADYPNSYEDYPFEKWLAFMQWRTLVATYPTQMIELSHNGQDFLKYLAHFGHDISKKPN